MATYDKVVQIKQALAKPSIHWLAIFIPISLAVAYVPGLKNEIPLFFFSCLGSIVVAYWLGEATEQLADKVGSIWGGMMNAAFSNLPELIFGLIAVSKGLGSLAKAAWTGAIISNMLVVVGAAIMVGGYRYGTVTFPLDRAKDASAGLTIACVAILMPSIYAHAVDFSSESITASDVVKDVSVWLCLFLLMAYGGSIVYALAQFRRSEPALHATTLSEAFAPEKIQPSWNSPLAQEAVEVALMERTMIETSLSQAIERPWSVTRSLWVLAGSSAIIALLSNFIADSVDSSPMVWDGLKCFWGQL